VVPHGLEILQEQSKSFVVPTLDGFEVLGRLVEKGLEIHDVLCCPRRLGGHGVDDQPAAGVLLGLVFVDLGNF
jgi:hypothetical protein